LICVFPIISPLFGFVHKNEKQRQGKSNFYDLKIFVLPVPESRELPWHSLALAASAGVQPHRPDVLWEGKCAHPSEASGERRVFVSDFANFAPHMSPALLGASEASGVSGTKTNQVIFNLSA
jgi:hypothetical protein